MRPLIVLDRQKADMSLSSSRWHLATSSGADSSSACAAGVVSVHGVGTMIVLRIMRYLVKENATTKDFSADVFMRQLLHKHIDELVFEQEST